MTKSKKKNADSFLIISEISRGEVTNKAKLPIDSFTKFSLAKTDIFNTDLKDVFVLRREASEILSSKFTKKK